MMDPRHAAPSKRGVSLFGRLVAAASALCAGVGVGLAAYAPHGADGPAASRLQTAPLFAFGHGAQRARCRHQAPEKRHAAPGGRGVSGVHH